MLGHISIRDAVIGDAAELGRVHALAAEQSYGHYFPADFMAKNTAERRTVWWREQLSHAGSSGLKRLVLAHNADDALVGFAAAGAARDDDAPFSTELWRLYLLEPAQGTGAAQRLYDALALNHEPAYLWVMRDNPRAIGFYRKNGWQPDGTEVRLPHIGNLPKIRMVRRPCPSPECLPLSK